MDRVDERRECVLFDWAHLVFALINGPSDTVGFVVVHGISDREATHEVGDARLVAPEIFAQN